MPRPLRPIDDDLIYHVVNRGHNRAHGLGERDELVDPLITYEELSPYAKIRQRQWAAKVHQPLEDRMLRELRRSNSTGLPYGEESWDAESGTAPILAG